MFHNKRLKTKKRRGYCKQQQKWDLAFLIKRPKSIGMLQIAATIALQQFATELVIFKISKKCKFGARGVRMWLQK